MDVVLSSVVKKQGSRGKITPLVSLLVMKEVSLGLNVNYLNFLLVGDGTGTFRSKLLRNVSRLLRSGFSGKKRFNRLLLVSADTVGGVTSLFCRCALDAEPRRLARGALAPPMQGVNLSEDMGHFPHDGQQRLFKQLTIAQVDGRQPLCSSCANGPT